MPEFIAKRTCYWGAGPGLESLYVKGQGIIANGDEPGLLEFFEPLRQATESDAAQGDTPGAQEQAEAQATEPGETPTEPDTKPKRGRKPRE